MSNLILQIVLLSLCASEPCDQPSKLSACRSDSFSEACPLDAAIIAMTRRQYDTMLVKAKEAVKIEPDNKFAYLFLGIALYRLRRYHEAIVRFSRAIALDSNLSEAYLMRARAHVKLGTITNVCADLVQAKTHGSDLGATVKFYEVNCQ